MVAPLPEIPPSVIAHIRSVFGECSHRAATKMSRMPTTHETSLDLSIIECISSYAGAQQVGDQWVVTLDAHYLGGGRHFGEWEIADLGLIVVIRDRGKVHLRKVALLQSKRLYPNEQGLEEDTPLDYIIGFARLMPHDISALAAEEQRRFSFTTKSKYRALRVNDRQYLAIQSFEEQHGVPVHYLLHHPLDIPWEQTIPVRSTGAAQEVVRRVGPRVVRARDLRAALKEQGENYHPTFRELSGEGWALDEFVADEILKCREGYIAESADDPGLFEVFNRRSGPIAASIAITIDYLNSEE